ncbi:MAG: apolipoprotein N-acyltransferase [Acidobacteriia bacterium]|nr:apolipoprotein N-acyltransferase [Terriglobia bacterium]
MAALSGVLQVLVFPRPDLSFLCWISLTPLLVAILAGQQKRLRIMDPGGRDLGATTPGQGFLLGYLSGIIWYAGSCSWVFDVMHIYGGLSVPVALGILILYCLYLALYHAAFGLVLAILLRRSGDNLGRVLALVPCLWVAVELARTRISGFSWDVLGTAQVDNIPLTGIATVTGVYGLSFGIALVNSAFAAAFLLPPVRRRLMLVASVAAAVSLQAGVLALPPAEPTTHTARLVQANVPILEGGAWSLQYFQKTVSELSAVSEQPAPSPQPPQPRLIVWPESPTPFFLNDPMFQHAIMAVASETGSYVLVGSIGVRSSPGRQRPSELLNSAALMSPAGQWVGRYDKVHLVPFGEYVPFKSLLRFAQSLMKETGDFSPGTERTVFTLNGHKLGVFICYESVFPDEIRIFAARGAEVFLNISNDGWFGDTGAPYQHLNMARMRAIENRRWLLRGTNSGITGAIDPYGRMVTRAPRHERIAIDVPYAYRSDTTFYTRHGDLFAYLCAIIVMVALFVRIRFRAGTIRTS